MNVLSLFDGMSCGQIALNRLGIHVNKYYASEIDEHGIKITQKNFPKTIQLGSVTDVTAGSLSQIDLLIGGSPCQGFSFAGHQLNFSDPRSKLFFEYVRILKEIRQTNPDVKFLLENVKMKKEYLDVISEALGVQPFFINSSVLSAHNRQRYYWTNIEFDKNIEDAGLKLSDIIESGYVDRDKAYCIDANYFKGGNLTQYFQKSRRQLVFLDPELTQYRKLTVGECEALQTVPKGYTSGVSNTQAYRMLGNGWTIDVIAHIFKPLQMQQLELFKIAS